LARACQHYTVNIAVMLLFVTKIGLAANFQNPLGKIWTEENWATTTHDWAEFGCVDKDKYHEGIDFDYKDGSAVYATEDGEIVFVNHNHLGDGKWGNTIIIKHSKDLYSQYSHLSEFENFIKDKLCTVKDKQCDIDSLGNDGYNGIIGSWSVAHIGVLGNHSCVAHVALRLQ